MKAIINKIIGIKKKVTAYILIETREHLSKEIKDYWNIVIRGNLTEKGTKQPFDIKKTYEEIVKKEAELIKTKLYIQAVNMGLKSTKGISKNNIYEKIYRLSQLKEREVKLKQIPVKKEENKTVVLTSMFVRTEIVKIKREINIIEKEIAKFNNELEFEIAA